MINEAMVPGKVENWVAVVDLQNVGVTQIPKDLLSAMGKALSSNFRGRMFRTFAINMPMLVRALWAVVKNIIDHFQQQKIHIMGGNYKAELLKLIEAKNIEKKYGGELENLTEGSFFPPNLN